MSPLFITLPSYYCVHCLPTAAPLPVAELLPTFPSPGSGRRAASVRTPTPSTSLSSTSSGLMHGHSDNITISHVNINSITSRGRLDELSFFASTNSIDILCLSETKLDDKIHPSLYSLDYFHDPLTRHRDRNGGGVAIYIRNNLAVKRLVHLETPDLEWVWCLVKIKQTTLIICSLYMPPNQSSSQYSTFLNKLTDSIALAQAYAPHNIFILGDFNAGNTFLETKFTNHSPLMPFESALHDEILACDLQQIITEPTRYSDQTNTANLRDLILTSNVSMINASGVLPPFSQIDHLPTYVSLAIDTPSISIHTVKLWDFGRTDTNKLTRLLMGTDWDSLLDCDLDQATDNLTNALISAANASIPYKTFSTKSNNKPWFNLELKRQIRKRDRLFHIAKRRNTPQDWERWKRQRNITTETNQRLKTVHIQSQVEKLLEHRRDPRTYHNILKRLTGRISTQNIPPLIHNGLPTTDDLTKATILNQHFAKQTRLDIQEKLIPNITPPRNPIPSLSEVQVTELEVLKILNSLDINKSSGPDKIPNKLIKMSALLIAKPLANFFNKSLLLGKFPSSWKRACVTPIFKHKGSSSDPTNYRPISLLPTLSKVFEKLIFQKIYEHISENNLLTEKQSGYRPGHSTHLQLIYLTHQLHSALNENNNFTAIFLDISKYFDKIWHNALLKKCQIQYNISGLLLSWLTSYLTDRSQVVRIGNSISPPEKLLAGCPQGSVLGPLLALLYLNDLSDKTENDALFYADDTSLYISYPRDSQQHIQTLQNDLDTISQYGDDWAITFNANKTIQQTFTNRLNNQDPKLSFNGQNIPSTTSHKHLGLTISTDLHFHQHVNDIIKKVNMHLGPIYPIAKFLPRHILNDLYATYIRPHFDYCDIIYDGNLTVTDASRLQILQNRCARLVTGTLYRTSTDALLKDLGWERLKQRRLIHKLLFFHRLYYNNPPLPSYLTNLITANRLDVTRRDLRNAQLLSTPNFRLTSFKKSFIPDTIRQWNLLPESFRNSPSHRDFTRQVRQRFGAPEPPPLHSVGTKIGNTRHTQLRVGLSPLKAHLFQIQLSPSPECTCTHKHEDTPHFLLWCPNYTNQRQTLINAAQSIIPHFDNLSTQCKLKVLLHGENLTKSQGIRMALHLQTYIAHTQRFSTQHNH